MNRALASVLVLVVAASEGAAQIGLARIGASVVLESYSLEDGAGFREVHELSVPTTVRVGLGQRTTLVVSAGYASVSVAGLGPDEDTDRTLSGFLDTEARLAVTVVPNKLLLLLTGAAPTGIGGVAREDAGLLGPLSSDVIGFATASLGTGGHVGVGVAGAVSVGSMALGYGASLQEHFSYVPVIGASQNLKPGREVRLRAGLEGSIGRRTYLRLAAIASGRVKDRLGGELSNGVGHRIAAYALIERRMGRVNTSLYAFDIYRSDPRLEPTAVGAAVVPRGNALAVGARVALPISGAVTVAPRAEYRRAAVETVSGDATQSLGSTIRFGADVQLRLTTATTLVLEGTGLEGDVNPGAGTVAMTGYRAAMHLEWTR